MPEISQHQRLGDHLPFNRKDLQVEEVVEADGHTRVCTSGDLANGQQHARHEGDAVEAVGASFGSMITGIILDHATPDVSLMLPWIFVLASIPFALIGWVITRRNVLQHS